MWRTTAGLSDTRAADAGFVWRDHGASRQADAGKHEHTATPS